MSNKQIYDFYETDRITYESRGIAPITCVQLAGDVMIIPESWGHGVLNIQETIAMATEYKYSIWRVKPPPTVLNHLDGMFNNRAGGSSSSGDSNSNNNNRRKKKSRKPF